MVGISEFSNERYLKHKYFQIIYSYLHKALFFEWILVPLRINIHTNILQNIVHVHITRYYVSFLHTITLNFLKYVIDSEFKYFQLILCLKWVSLLFNMFKLVWHPAKLKRKFRLFSNPSDGNAKTQVDKWWILYDQLCSVELNPECGWNITFVLLIKAFW